MNALTMTTTATGSNSEEAMKALRAELRKLGSAEALGSSSRPEAGLRIVNAAYDGLLKEGDAEQVYAAYQAGLIEIGRKRPLSVGADASEKVQVSKFRQLIRVGMLPSIDARALMQKVAEAMKSHVAAGIRTVAPFDAMLNAARMQLTQPQVDLTDEQVDKCVAKPEAARKEDLEKLIDAFKRVSKLHDTVHAPSADAALQAMKDWITEKGGEIPPMTKDEKDRKEFLKRAARFGYSVSAAA